MRVRMTVGPSSRVPDTSIAHRWGLMRTCNPQSRTEADRSAYTNPTPIRESYATRPVPASRVRSPALVGDESVGSRGFVAGRLVYFWVGSARGETTCRLNRFGAQGGKDSGTRAR